MPFVWNIDFINKLLCNRNIQLRHITCTDCTEPKNCIKSDIIQQKIIKVVADDLGFEIKYVLCPNTCEFPTKI